MGGKEIQEKDKLKNGISSLYELELNNYFMERTIHTLDEKIPKLGIPQQLIPPKKEEAVPQETYGCFLYPFMMFLGWSIGAYIGSSIDCYDDTFYLRIIGIIVGGVAAFVINRFLKNKAVKESEEEAELKYKKENGLYLRKVESENKRLEREEKMKEELIKERNILKSRCYESKGFMTEIYNEVGIDSKFRTLTIMGYMEEYIRLGISDHLGGVDGLYLLIQNRVRDEIAQATWNDISNKLSSLVDLHEDIRYELNQMNRKSDEMINLMERSVEQSARSNEINEEIRENSAATAYNIERMRREEEIRDMLR